MRRVTMLNTPIDLKTPLRLQVLIVVRALGDSFSKPASPLSSS